MSISQAAAEPEPDRAPDSIVFQEGIPGWPESSRWELLRCPDADPLLWLRDRDRPSVALVVLDPRGIDAGYRPALPAEVRRRLELEPEDRPLFLCVVTLGERGEEATVNLRAPIVINTRRMKGAQVILDGAELPLAQPILPPPD